MMNELAGSKQQSQVWTIKGLGAEGPFPELKEKLMLFGQFVGDWEMDARYPQPDGTEIKAKGEIHFGWILNGRGVQDGSGWVRISGQEERSHLGRRSDTMNRR